MQLRTIGCLIVGCLCVSAFAEPTTENNANKNKINFHISTLYLQPNANNLKYAVFVSGNQPYYQSWHNQTINPSYSPALELGMNYGFRQTAYEIFVDWLHVGTSDSSSKQATENTDIATVQFVAPPYDVGPAVFGIKRANSTVKSNFNSILLNIGKTFEYSSNIKTEIFGGINVLTIDQNLETTFSDYKGSPPIPGQAYALPADPSYNFTTKNTSEYLGVGPNLGINAQYKSNSGFGLNGQVLGTLTVGTISAEDDFISSSTRLNALGIMPSSQSITVPNATQLVPGVDSKIGIFYEHTGHDMGFAIEAGYRFAYYMNAISTISPDTLVQAGVDPTVPEFATGTMAINSTTTSNSPFSLNGPYLTLTITII